MSSEEVDDESEEVQHEVKLLSLQELAGLGVPLMVTIGVNGGVDAGK